MYYKRKQMSTIQIGHKFLIIYDIIQAMKHVGWPNWVKIEVLPYEVLYIISYAEFNGESISGLIKVKSSSVWSTKFCGNLYWKDTTKYNLLCLTYSSILPFLHIMIIRNPIFTIGQKVRPPRIFPYLSNQGTPKENLHQGFMLYTETPFQPFPLVVSTISLPPQRIIYFYFNMKMKDCSD